MKDTAFTTANRVFKGQIKKTTRESYPKSETKLTMTQADIDQVYNGYFIPNLDHPVALQHKVFFDLMSCLKQKSRESLRDLKKESFSIGLTENGQEFIQKVDSDSDTDCDGKDCIVAEGGPGCPVASFKKYIANLNPDCEWFFQKPNIGIFQNPNDYLHGCWYLNLPIGKNTIGVFMKEISKSAGLQTIYNNSNIKSKHYPIMIN